MRKWTVVLLMVAGGVAAATASTVVVKAIGDDGWKSDDTRDATGANLVGLNYTHYGKPGQTPTAADDAAIANQIKFPCNGPGGTPALELTKQSIGGGFSKSTLSKVNPAGFATGNWRSGFTAKYRYYATSSAEAAVLKLGVQSTLWGTGAGQSQNGFTALRSGESAWDVILVDWRGTDPGWTINAWDQFDTDADTVCWKIYRQAGNTFFNAPPTATYSLNQIAALPDVAVTIGSTSYTWGDVIFGSAAKVASIQFGVGSSAQSTTSYIDWLETNLLNGGDRIEFGVDPKPVWNATQNTYHCTIQGAIDAANPGDTIHVYPGNYDETAAGRYLYDSSGPYQFGLFIDKDNLTIQGVTTGGTPITDADDVAAFITTNATNSFGYSGTFVQADNVTIMGLAFGPNAAGTNKTMEVIGDNVTIKYCRFEDREAGWGGGSLYIGDFRHNGSPGGAYLKSYHLEGNYFDYGSSVDLANGAGDGPGTRSILNNTFHMVDPDVNVYWAVVSFNGADTGVPWFVYTVGGATVTGNVFIDGEQYIRARGTYDNTQFDWASFWDDNVFERAAVVLVDDGDPFDVRTYSYTSGSYVFNNSRRIGGLIQGEVDHALAGDTVRVKPGLYEEQVVIGVDNLHLIGAGSGNNPAVDTVIRSPVTLPWFFTTSVNNYPVVGVHDATGVTIENLRVDGYGRGNGHYRFMGIAFWKAGGEVKDCCVTGVRETPLSGNQHGIGIYAFNDNSGTYTVNVTDTTVDDYQKNGMALNGLGLTANLSGCTMTGAGATSINAQNGVQIGLHADGSLVNCTASGHVYVPATWAASDVLLYDAGTVTVSGCTLGDANAGVYIVDTNATVTNTNVTFTHPKGLYGLIAYNTTADKAAARPAAQPVDEGGAELADKGPGDMAVAITGGVFQGAGHPSTSGLYFYSNAATVTGTITGATVKDWDYGIVADEDNPGVVSLTATGNHILNNVSYGFVATGPTIQMAEYNDWGSGEGPLNPAGTYEVSSVDCGSTTVNDMVNVVPGGGLGNEATEYVDYCPWTVGALCTLTTADTCYAAGDTLTVDLVLTGATENVAGGQWWIEFDPTYLTFVGAAGQAPWDGFTFVNPGPWPYPANVKFVHVGDLVAPLGATSGTMVKLTFNVNASFSNCNVGGLVKFTNPLTGAPPTRLAGVITEEIYPGLQDLGAITMDNTPPAASVSAAGANVDGACTATVTFAGTVSDNCGILAANVGVAVGLTTGNATLGAPTITKTQVDAQTVTISGSVAVSALTSCPATVQVTLTATDCGGNAAAPAVATADVNDVTPPVISGCPANITVPADAGQCSAVVTWTPPTAGDNCSVASFTSTHNSGATFPVGTTMVTYSATDACGNAATPCSFTVTVLPVNEVKLNIELRSAPSSYPFTRCITFEFDPGNVTVSQVISFTAGRADNVIVTVPISCSPLTPFNCVRARDVLHTLWAAQTQAEGFGISGAQYVADFTDDNPPLDNRPVLGNLNEDPWVDVIDFGIYVVRFGLPFDLDTTCATTGRHPNMVDLSPGPIDLVDTADFNVIQVNFLLTDDTGCGAKHLGGRGPVTRISVEALKAQGLAELIPADLNGDGWLDTLDMEAFAAGARPARPGDLNADGVVNFADVDAFVLALEGEAAYLAVYPQGRWLNGDLNGDGAVTLEDSDLLVTRLQQP